MAIVTAATALVSSHFPRHLLLGEMLVGGAGLLLGQGLVRDLARLRARNVAERTGEAQVITCMCVESTLGVGVITAGCILLFAWSPVTLAMSRLLWTGCVGAILTFGFCTKDLVMDWRERRIRREANHALPLLWKR